ncbi:hypothetical protein EOM39_03620 [Candidatus Gracilibacteria bacterium]|nr:hypothetical protein [Candidatus Gracilibacteria bacterium]
MFRYYKNMLFFVKNSFVYRGGGEDRDETVIEQPYPIIQETKESSDWKESTLFAGRQVTPSIKQSYYKVYVRETNGKSDIKIVRPIFRWDVVLKGIPKGREQDAIDEVMKKDLGLIAGNELIWDDTRGKLEGTREDYESNKPLRVGDLGEQKAFFDSLLDDTDLTLSELNSINYDKIEKILRQSFSANYQKDDIFINNRNDLIIAIDKVISDYHKRLRQGDPNFKNHPRFEQFVKYKETITNSIIADGKEFVDSIDKLGLAELLDTYKKAGTDDGKRYTLLQKIVDKHITGKGNSLAFGSDGKIVINTLDEKQKLVEAKDLDSVNIINTVSQSDLKGDVLRNIISDTGFDINSEKPDYPTLIPKILKKYEIKDDAGGIFVFHDIFRRKSDLRLAIQEKLIGKPDIKIQRDLDFVLDYIDNQKSYPQETILKATEMANLRKSGYDPTTVEGAARIEKAIKSGNVVNTILNDIKSANGGLVGAAIFIGSIIGLFLGGKWRTAALWSLGIQILGPAAEQLAHKWGLAEYILKDLNTQKTGETGGLVAGLENPFKKVDITIKNIPKKYEEVYGNMYKKNISGSADKMIFPQDYAQIFSCLVQKHEVRNMDLNVVKTGLANGDSPKDILGKANIPKKYIKGILQTSGKDKIIDDADRNISDADMKLFLELLVSQAEPLDKTLGDVFVKGQETPTEYLDNKVYGIENTAISAEMDKISFSSPARSKLDEIVGRTKEIFSVENTVAKFDNTKRIEQINAIIVDLNKLKTIDISLTASIDIIIGEYEKVIKNINLGIKVDDFKSKAKKEGELFPGMSYITDTANTGLGLLSTAVGYLKLDPSNVPKQFKELDLNKIDELIKEGESIFILSGNTSEQKKEIEKIIVLLKEKKLAFLRSKDRLDTTIPKGKMSEKTKDSFVLLIESNHEYYDKSIKKIDLKSLPSSESLLGYNNLLVQNYEGLLFLQSIVDIDDTKLGKKGKNIKTLAQIKLEEYKNPVTGFEKNLKDYIEKKKIELSQIDIARSNLENIKSNEEKFIKIKEEFIKDGVIYDNLNKLGEIYGIEALTTKGNSISDFEEYYNQLLGKTINLDSGGFKAKLDEVEQCISKKIIELINSEKLPDLNKLDITKEEQIAKFVNEVKAYKKKLNEFLSSNKELVNLKLTELNGKIGELEQKFISGLTGDINNNANLADKWKKIKNDLDYNENGFDNELINKTKQIHIAKIKSFTNINDLKIYLGGQKENLNGIEQEISIKIITLFKSSLNGVNDIAGLKVLKSDYQIQGNKLLGIFKCDDYKQSLIDKIVTFKTGDLWKEDASIFSSYETFYNNYNSKFTKLQTDRIQFLGFALKDYLDDFNGYSTDQAFINIVGEEKLKNEVNNVTTDINSKLKKYADRLMQQ